MAPKTFECTPLSIAVPLDGTERQLGIRQLQRQLSRPKIRSQYRRFSGPFLDSLTPEDVQRCHLKSWKEFLPSPETNIKRPCSAFSIPGSVIALCERIEENLFFFLANYVQLMIVTILVILGMWRGLLCVIWTVAYFTLKDPDPTLDEKWNTIRQGIVQVLLPVAGILWLLLASIGGRLVFGILLGLVLVLIHAATRRSRSEMRYKRQVGVIRWMRRQRAPVEGSAALWVDLRCWLEAGFATFCIWMQWQWLFVRDRIGILRWMVMQRFKQKLNRNSLSYVH